MLQGGISGSRSRGARGVNLIASPLAPEFAQATINLQAGQSFCGYTCSCRHRPQYATLFALGRHLNGSSKTFHQLDKRLFAVVREATGEMSYIEVEKNGRAKIALQDPSGRSSDNPPRPGDDEAAGGPAAPEVNNPMEVEVSTLNPTVNNASDLSSGWVGVWTRQ